MSIITEAICTQYDAELIELRAQKDLAYSERNKLVALISKIFPAFLGRHEESDLSWDPEWTNIVYVSLPAGQCSWHIHSSELHLFSHLKYNSNIKWDGHTTDEKYKRIESFSSKVVSNESNIIDLINCRVTC